MMHMRLTEINGGLAGMALKQESGQTHFYYCMNILYILLNLNVLCDVVPPRLGVSRFMIFSRLFVMLDFLFCKLFEQHRQFEPNLFPYHKDKAFQGNII